MVTAGRWSVVHAGSSGVLSICLKLGFIFLCGPSSPLWLPHLKSLFPVLSFFLLSHRSPQLCGFYMELNEVACMVWRGFVVQVLSSAESPGVSHLKHRRGQVEVRLALSEVRFLHAILFPLCFS